MKDEIKEINIPENVLVALGDLTNGAMNYYKATETVKVRHNTILDYITNLQEEKDKYKNVKDKIKEYAGELRSFDNESVEFEISNKILELLEEVE